MMAKRGNCGQDAPATGGLAGWLLGRLRGAKCPQPRLAVVERITLAPRQSLALVDVEGRRFLIATSPEGAAAFHALDDRAVRPAARVSLPPGKTARRPW